MPSARDASEWAASGGLHGLGDSLYTPFSGPEGDAIDYDAYRTLVRYCVGDLEHEMLWLTSSVSEFWALTLEEREKLVEVAIEEARSIAPDTVIQVCTSSATAKDCLALTQHAEAAGADICFIQTPSMEVHGGEGVLRFFRYVADRSDIALGMFNSPSSGYVLTAREMAQIYDEIPAVVAVKEGVQDSYLNSARLHALAPGLQIWECDDIVYRAGWLQQGIVTPAQLGSRPYLTETPGNRRERKYWELIWAGEIPEAIKHAEESGLDNFIASFSQWVVRYPGRPGYLAHWGEGFRYGASLLGLPIGDYPHSRPPQGIFPEEHKAGVRRAFERYGAQRAVMHAGAVS